MSDFLYRGIDLSEHNGTVNFDTLKRYGVDFVLLRAGYGSANKYPEQYDTKFEEYYQKAKAAGLGVGAYWYSYAGDMQSAEDEIKAFATVLEGKTFEYPVYFDLEESSVASAVGRTTYTDIAKYMIDTLESMGYWVGLYASLSFLSNKLDMLKLKRFAVWCAQWNNSCDYNGAGMWQYCNDLKVPGCSTLVDGDYCYRDYPKEIKDKGLNGFSLKTDNAVTKINQMRGILDELEDLI